MGVNMATENRELLELYEQRLIEIFGASDAQKVVRLLIEVVGGARITVPTLKQIEIEFRDKRIRERFNGLNHSELSMESGLSIRHIRRIVNNGC